MALNTSIIILNIVFLAMQNGTWMILHQPTIKETISRGLMHSRICVPSLAMLHDNFSTRNSNWLSPTLKNYLSTFSSFSTLKKLSGSYQTAPCLQAKGESSIFCLLCRFRFLPLNLATTTQCRCYSHITSVLLFASTFEAFFLQGLAP